MYVTCALRVCGSGTASLEQKLDFEMTIFEMGHHLPKIAPVEDVADGDGWQREKRGEKPFDVYASLWRHRMPSSDSRDVYDTETVRTCIRRTQHSLTIYSLTVPPTSSRSHTHARVWVCALLAVHGV